MRGISWLVENRLPLQDGPYSMESVNKQASLFETSSYCQILICIQNCVSVFHLHSNIHGLSSFIIAVLESYISTEDVPCTTECKNNKT